MVEARIGRSTYWAAEVKLETANAKSPRVDYMSFRLNRGDRGQATAASMERGIFACYEVKSCMDDFKSGHGLNFVGDENYLVCERELADLIYQSMQIPENCIVLCPNKSRSALIEVYNVFNRSMRKKSAAELLFSMVVSGIRRPSDK